MAKGTISLPPWPGAKPASETGTTLVEAKPKVPVTEADRTAALAAVHFFYKECNLGATLLARKIGWNSDVKSILQRAAGLTVEHVERIASALDLSPEEFLYPELKSSRFVSKTLI
jgi:antitoxin component HigA of HigAB toxin-antitoxin module